METVRIRVSAGELVDSGSWLYVWRRPDGQVVHVGGTGLPPAVRTWLHLHGEGPQVARIRARCPGAASESFEVVAFRLPDDVPRAEARGELVRRLAAVALLAEDHVADPAPAGAAADHVTAAVQRAVSELLATAARG